jgi:hypothetical protein
MLVKPKPKLIEQKKKRNKLRKLLKKLKITQKKLKKLKSLAIQIPPILKQIKLRPWLKALNNLQATHQIVVKIALIIQKKTLILIATLIAIALQNLNPRAKVTQVVAQIINLMQVSLMEILMITQIQMMIKVKLMIPQLKTHLQMKKTFRACQVWDSMDKNQETRLWMKLLNN